jgi:hypothetical protein
MRIYLGGHLNFYHPKKENWLEVELNQPEKLIDVLEASGIPLGEVHLVVIDGDQVILQSARVSDHDEIKLYSAVGGG